MVYLLLTCAVGRFASLSAKDIKRGDKLAVLTDESNPAAGFTAVAVTGVERLQDEGKYLPALSKPYIIANGVVTPL